MARVPLRDVVLTPAFRGQARLAGSFSVYLTGGAVAATVYGAATGTTTVTQPVPFNDHVSQVGWVESGEYVLSANSYTQNIEANAGDGGTGSATSLFDPTVSAQNMRLIDRNSISATATSQLVRLVRIVPQSTIVVAKIVSFSGTTAVS